MTDAPDFEPEEPDPSGASEGIRVPDWVAALLKPVVWLLKRLGKSLLAIVWFVIFYVEAICLGHVLTWMNRNMDAPQWLTAWGEWVERILIGADILVLVVVLLGETGAAFMRAWDEVVGDG